MGKQAKRSGIKKHPKLKLTQGETYFIERKRSGMTQAEMARKLAISVKEYRLIEADKHEPRFTIEITNLAPHEACVIARKRANMSQQELADYLGISRTWLRLQETGEISCAQLLTFWE